MRKTFIKLKTVNNLKSFINELTSKNRKQGFNRIKITPLSNGIINRFMKFSKNNNIKNTFNNNYRNGYIEENRNFIMQNISFAFKTTSYAGVNSKERSPPKNI